MVLPYANSYGSRENAVPKIGIGGLGLSGSQAREVESSDCFKRYVADLPEGDKKDEKFDGTADIAIALYKY
jgi:hypothetical protein